MTQEVNKKQLGQILNDPDRPLKERFRALFKLKNVGGQDSVDMIAQCFRDTSALLRHELAYCLGQMQDTYAIPHLTKVLENKAEDPMVRHEAGEALGAIGSAEVVQLLEKYAQDPVTEVAETCQLALQRINWLQNKDKNQESLSENPYMSVDPAPPCIDNDISVLKGRLLDEKLPLFDRYRVAETCQLALQRINWLQNKDKNQESLSENPYMSVDPAPPCIDNDISVLKGRLLDEKLPLFDRYRAMFSLRNTGTPEAVLALAEGLKCSSALFRHEVAYVLGQIQSDVCVRQLAENLRNEQESPMVRHECAEALGSIATDESMQILEDYKNDSERVVKESCVVALDISEYQTSEQFQF